MKIRYKTTKEALDNDLPRIMMYIDEFSGLKEMCSKCEKWRGKDHDYNSCLDTPCFTFFRAFEYLEFYNSYLECPDQKKL